MDFYKLVIYDFIDYYFSLIGLIIYLIIIMLILPEENKMRTILIFIGSCAVLILNLALYIHFSCTALNILYCVSELDLENSLFYFDFSFYFDALSLTLLLLTNLIFVISVYYSLYNVKSSIFLFFNFNIFLIFLLNIIFCILDLFVFYILFEFVLLPLFFLISL